MLHADKEGCAIRLLPAVSFLPTCSSVLLSFTCLCVHTSMPQFLCSSIIRVHLSHHVSHLYLSIYFQVHPSRATHTSVHMPPLYKFIFPSGHSVSFPHICWLVCNLFSLLISEMISLSLCSSFNKRTLQTSVDSSAYPITHLSTTTALLSLSLIQKCSFAS